MIIPHLLTEDHCHAYGFWKEHKVSDAVCVHVDAHLDVMDRGFSEEILLRTAKTDSLASLKHCLTPTYLPWSGVHCGNYLYPALIEAMVTHLIWVVPKFMLGEASMMEFLHRELPNWVELTFCEFHSLKPDGKRVEGRLAGRRFTVCTSDDMPILEDRLTLLDIDVDYFQGPDDLIWQTPQELLTDLKLDRYDLLTVAISVDGGYTCQEHRYLGDVTVETFLNPTDTRWEESVKAILGSDSQRVQEPDTYDTLLGQGLPSWLRAALVLKQALANHESLQEATTRAGAVDGKYQYLAVNEALVHFRNGRHEPALALLRESEENRFIQAIVAFQAGQYEMARQCWDDFLRDTELQPIEIGYARFIRGQAQLQLGDFVSAVEDFTFSSKVEPTNYQYKLYEGLALQLQGELKKAARVWRKALALYDDRVLSIGLHLELSRLYRSMNKSALAEAELARVRQKDLNGAYKMTIQMEHLRAARPATVIPTTSLQGLWTTPMGVR